MGRVYAFLLALSFCGLSHSVPAQAQYFQAEMMKRKLAEKDSSRWTLMDYLSQKQRMSLMDMWLSANRSGYWFDLALSGAAVDYESQNEGVSGSSQVSDSGTAYQAAVYLWFLGIEGEAQSWDPDWNIKSAALSLRLLGAHQQSTRLNLKYGIRRLEYQLSTEEWENPFAEAEINLYLVKRLGLIGRYQKLLAAESTSGIEQEGERSTVGVFLEFGVLRLFAESFRENIIRTQAAGKDEIEIEGTLYGAGFYF